MTGAGDGAHEISAQQIRRSFVDFDVPQGRRYTNLLSEDSANTGDDIIQQYLHGLAAEAEQGHEGGVETGEIEMTASPRARDGKSSLDFMLTDSEGTSTVCRADSATDLQEWLQV